MTTSVRLPKEIEDKLNQIARAENKTKSEIIRDSIELYSVKYSKTVSPYELGKGLFGRRGSGRHDLSIDGKKILREKIKKK